MRFRRNWQLNPKQDHLVCFLGGSLLLGVTEARLSVPPNVDEFSPTDLEDWEVGTGLIRTCVDTYNTKTFVGYSSRPHQSSLTPSLLLVQRTRPRDRLLLPGQPGRERVEGLVHQRDDVSAFLFLSLKLELIRFLLFSAPETISSTHAIYSGSSRSSLASLPGPH